MPPFRVSSMVLLLAIAGLRAQACNPGDQLLKNDILPNVPTGLQTVAIVPGLCEGEAAMSVLTTPGPCTVRKVSIMFGNAGGGNGNLAVADVEIYDGATLNPNGRYTLGPLVWSLSGTTGNNVQISTHAINEVTVPGNVRITSGKAVIGWRMEINAGPGSCQLGYFNNFCVDYSGVCQPGKNIIDALPPIGGPVDPITFPFPPINIPLCGTIYWSGNWIIRACVTPDVTVNWSGTPTPGGAVLLNLFAPNHANEYYVTMLSLGTSPGLTTPWGLIPLNGDFLLECSLNPFCWPQLLVNGNGRLNANAQATAVALIPNLPLLANSGLAFHAGFVTSLSPTWTPFTAISAPSTPIVIN